MPVLNIIAAVLLALMPALEPCRLHGMFTHADAESAVAEQRHHCHRHSHETAPADHDPCPDCPEDCDHLRDAAALPALTSASVLIPCAPCQWAGPAFAAPTPAPSPAWMFQHPPPTGVALVGTTNLRI